MNTKFVYGNGLESILVLKWDDDGRVEKSVPAREAFMAGEALTVLAIILAQADLEELRRDYAGMGLALYQAARVLREAGL